jgi:hypothetical protein
MRATIRRWISRGRLSTGWSTSATKNAAFHGAGASLLASSPAATETSLRRVPPGYPWAREVAHACRLVEHERAYGASTGRYRRGDSASA